MESYYRLPNYYTFIRIWNEYCYTSIYVKLILINKYWKALRLDHVLDCEGGGFKLTFDREKRKQRHEEFLGSAINYEGDVK